MMKKVFFSIAIVAVIDNNGFVRKQDCQGW